MDMYKGPILEGKDGHKRPIPEGKDGYKRPILKGKDDGWEERLASIGGPLLAWYKTHARDLPWRQDKDPYRIWISEIMLQQTRVEAVKPYFLRFMERLPRVTALAQVEEEVLLKLWEGLGYYSRARNLKKAAMEMVERYGGRVPSAYEELLKLPGIGSYTAGAIASIAYKVPVPAVDGNVLRVISRVLGSAEDIARPQTKTWMEGALKKTMDQEEPGLFNQGLFEVGALLCTPYKRAQRNVREGAGRAPGNDGEVLSDGRPGCGDCPLAFACVAREKGLWREIPVKSGKKARRIEEKTVLVLRGWKERAEDGPERAEGSPVRPDGLKGTDRDMDGSGERVEVVALRKRPPRGLLASLYEFPNVEGKLVLDPADAASRAVLSKITGVAEEKIWDICPLGEAKHVFSHVEWHMVGYQICVADGLPQSFICADIRELEGKYPLPSAFLAYRKALSKVKYKEE